MAKELIGGISLAGLVLLAATQLPGTPQLPTESRTEPGVVVHLFEWTWNDVAQECEQYLGPRGFSAVQVSPPQEHVVLADQGHPWWERYQPVSYRLESRSGSRAEFAAMVQRCRSAGVAVYADAVINHMAGIDGGVGSAGTAFTKYSYPGLYDAADFHSCHTPIKDYQKADEVTQCELVGLADLNTGSAHVQQELVNYLADVAGLGVAGFRIDAAKHMRSPELTAILTQLQQQVDQPLYIYQEVIDPGNEAIKKQDYYGNGDVVDFEYGRLVGESFLGLNQRTLADLEHLNQDPHLAPSEEALVFIDNHDKQRGHGGGGHYLTHKNPQLYTLANVFMLAYPYGHVRVMSSFAFDDSDQGPPMDDAGNPLAVYQQGQATCFEAWICEHRWTAITNMVGFHNATADRFDVTDWWSNGSNQIAFGRGELGYVVINQDSQPLSRTWQTQLPAGRYCNVITGAIAAGGDRCEHDAAIITVEPTGQFTATVPATTAIAFHVGAKLPDLR